MVKSNVFLDSRVCSWSSDHNTANWINKNRATERERDNRLLDQYCFRHSQFCARSADTVVSCFGPHNVVLKQPRFGELVIYQNKNFAKGFGIICQTM